MSLPSHDVSAEFSSQQRTQQREEALYSKATTKPSPATNTSSTTRTSFPVFGFLLVIMVSCNTLLRQGNSSAWLLDTSNSNRQHDEGPSSSSSSSSQHQQQQHQLVEPPFPDSNASYAVEEIHRRKQKQKKISGDTVESAENGHGDPNSNLSSTNTASDNFTAALFAAAFIPQEETMRSVEAIWDIADNHGRLAPQPHVDDLTMDRQKPSPYTWDEAVIDQIVSLAANVSDMIDFEPPLYNSFCRGTQWKREQAHPPPTMPVSRGEEEKEVGMAVNNNGSSPMPKSGNDTQRVEATRVFPKTRQNQDYNKNGGIHPKSGLPWRRFANQLRDPSDTVEIRFGILTIARFVNTRLLPMLNTSLLHATSVDVFIRKTNVSYAVADYIRASVRQFHPHWRGIRVVELYGPQGADEDDESKVHFHAPDSAKGVQFHNIWQNLEIMRFWRTEYELERTATHGTHSRQKKKSSSSRGNGDDKDEDPTSPNSAKKVHRGEWYCIMDDDGYVLLDSAKAMLWDLEQYERFEPYGYLQYDSLRDYGGTNSLVNHVKKSMNLTNPSVFHNPDTAPEDPRPNRFKRFRERLVARGLRSRKPTTNPTRPAPSSSTTSPFRQRDADYYLLPLRPLAAGALYVLGPDPFFNGGPGYFFNRAALRAVNASHYSHCLSAFRNRLGGDVIASLCLFTAGVKYHRAYHSSIFDPKSAVKGLGGGGASGKPPPSPYPCAFHKIKDGVHVLHMLRRLEEMRAARGELVHWDDIILNFNRTIPLNSTEYYADIVTAKK